MIFHRQILMVILILTPSLAEAQDLSWKSRAEAVLAQTQGTIELSGLTAPVEVFRDPWGIPHIYARNQQDLFFAQGFVAAQDRLWQMEMWRRQGEGKLAEILGPEAIERDVFSRLIRYRGNMQAEWDSYAPDAKRIVSDFVGGVNAFIRQAQNRMPLEFQIMGIRPEPWTPEVCITRMAGYVMCRNLSNEVFRAQLVRKVGALRAAELFPTEPFKEILIPSGLELDSIDDRILAGSRAAAGAVDYLRAQGSNNWVLTGRLTGTGKPILANDPHRTIALPSLRYIVHLSAPGWNVIGAGEPSLPGIAAGHNDRVAFGFTIVGIDQQDLYLEHLKPGAPDKYLYRGKWLPVRVEKENLRVKGRTEPVVAELRFTHHGPILFEDRQKNLAFALRWIGAEPGTAGYLASLTLNRVSNWKEFKEAVKRWKVPSENLVYADVAGNIGWHAAGLTPLRHGWSGLLPVPGDSGKYEWSGFLPMAALPNSFNPTQGFIATANHNIIPPGYRHELGYEWSSDFRFRRIAEVLKSRQGLTVQDSVVLQNDIVSLPARQLVPLLNEMLQDKDAGDLPSAAGDAPLKAAQRLLAWDCALTRDSPEAALYELWVNTLSPLVTQAGLAEDVARMMAGHTSLERVIRWLQNPSADRFGPDPVKGRNRVLWKSLGEALGDLRQRLGNDFSRWRWGNLHKAEFAHPLAGTDPLKQLLNLGSVSRPGDANTVNATYSAGGNFRQTSGASYRQIIDLADWDRSLVVNVPGQSGQPGSPHYGDLLPLWAEGKYATMLFSREKIESASRDKLLLLPRKDTDSSETPFGRVVNRANNYSPLQANDYP